MELDATAAQLVALRRRLPAPDLNHWGSALLEALHLLQRVQGELGASDDQRSTAREIIRVWLLSDDTKTLVG